MGTTKLPLSVDSPAYCLFIQELDKHLTFAHEEVGGDAQSLTPDIAKRLGASFHTIRGSAGFFGLSEVATIAKTLEELFFAVADGAPLDIGVVQPLLASMGTHTSDLPRPAQ